MALFKTNQYQVLAAVVNRVTQEIMQTDLSDLPDFQFIKPTKRLMCGTVEIIVAELCIEFAKDNRLFNETLFRSQCGSLISNQHAIMENNSGDK